MQTARIAPPSRNRSLLAAVLSVCALLALALSGCVANDENAMPWAAPSPSEGAIRLPGNFNQQ